MPFAQTLKVTDLQESLIHCSELELFGRVPMLACCHWFSSHLTAVQTCSTLLSRQHLSEAYESSNTAFDRQFPKSVHVSPHTRKDIKLFEDLSVVCPVGSSAVQHCMASAPFHTSRTNTTDKLALDHQTSVIQTSLCSASQRERETDSAMSHQFVMLVLSCSILMQGRCFFTLLFFLLLLFLRGRAMLHCLCPVKDSGRAQNNCLSSKSPSSSSLEYQEKGEC